MKTTITSPSADGLSKRCHSYVVSNIKTLLILLLFLSVSKFSNAQTCPDQGPTICHFCDSAHAAPSCSLIGPLKACLDAGNMIDSIVVDFTNNDNNNPQIDFSFSTNTSGATFGSPVETSFGNFEWKGYVISTPGTQQGTFTLDMDVYVTYPDGCTMHGKASMTTTIVDVTVAWSHAPIHCFGGTTTETVVGSGPEAYTYKLLPSGPTNTTGIFPGLTAGTYSFLVAGSIGAVTCDTTFTDIITQPDANPVILNCPNSVTEPACTSPSKIASDFTAWENGFSTSGGTNPIEHKHLPASAPDACTGGTVTATDTIYSDCQDPVPCSSTFTITAAPVVVFHCANDTTVSSCQTQSAVNAEYIAWIGTASASGGCNGVLSNNGGTTGPNACGGSMPVTFTYTVGSCGQTQSCTKTFTVTAAPSVSFKCANDTTVASCQTQTSVDAEFQAWLLTASASGGCPGSILSNNGGTSGPPACGGSKPVTFTYAVQGGCSTTQSCTKTFTVTAAPAVVFHCANDTTVSAGQSQAAIDAAFQAWLLTASASGGCSGNLSNNGGSSGPSNCGGSKQVTFTYTVGSCGQTQSCAKTFTVPSVTPVSCSNNGPLSCTTTSVMLTADNCTGSGVTYSWTGPGSFSSSSQCPSVSVGGTYTVVATNTASGCTSSCTTTVAGTTGGQTPDCSITLTGSLCSSGCSSGGYSGGYGGSYSGSYSGGYGGGYGGGSSGSVQLCAIAGYAGYIWSTGATTQCITVNSAGTYTVTVTNSSGCTSSCTKTVTAGTPPSCNISGKSSICSGQSTNLCAPAGSGLTYLWSTGETTQCINVSNAGTYSVTVTNSSGCSSICSQCVKISTPPSCTISTGCGGYNVCDPRGTTLCAPSNCDYCTTFLWSTGETTRCITATKSGTYTLTVTNCSGCSSTCSVTITIGTPPSCDISGNGNICDGQSTTLCAPAGNGLTYLWSTGATTQCINVCKAGTYCVTVTNSSGCSSKCSKCVTVSSAPSCTITVSCSGNGSGYGGYGGSGSYGGYGGSGSWGGYSGYGGSGSGCGNGGGSCNTICDGQSVTLCAPYGCNTYSWSTGETTQCITVTISGTYTVTVTSKGGCSSSCSQTITVNPAPTCNITGNLIIKQGQCTKLCAPDGYKYLWSNGATCQCITVNCPGTYSVTVTNSSGCSSSCSVCVKWQSSCQRQADPNSTGNIEVAAYPNPFNTTATFEIKNTDAASHVRIEIYSIEGLKVGTAFDGNVDAGVSYKAQFDAADHADGIYIYKIISDDNVVTTGRLLLFRN